MHIPVPTSKRSLFLATATALGLLVTALWLLSMSAVESLAQGPVSSSAHVVVQFASGDTAVRPVSWTGTISRVAALEAVGFQVAHSGDALCAIDGEGCPDTDCFCPDNLWAQGQWDGSAWDATAWPPPNVTDGDVVAFRNATQPNYSDWGLAGLLPAAPTYVAASDALEWMRGQQQSDGAYDDGFDRIGASVRALIALGSSGYDPAQWGSPSLLDFLTVVSRTATIDYAARWASAAGKLAVGAAWTGQTVTNFAGINLPLTITSFYSPTTGAYGAGSGDTAWAMLGLYAAGEDIPSQATAFLGSVQNADGGWAWNEWSSTSEVQHTAVCLQALLAAGEPITATEVTGGLAFIDSSRNSDGGYGYQVGSDSDADTTAFVVQSLMSTGRQPAGNWCATVGCRYLLSEQAVDGSFLFYGSPSLYATQDVIPALMHRPYGPLANWSYDCFVSYLPRVAKSAGDET
jgi:hypothetical protein